MAAEGEQELTLLTVARSMRAQAEQVVEDTEALESEEVDRTMETQTVEFQTLAVAVAVGLM